MMRDWRIRLGYLVGTLAVVAVGLGSRRYGAALPLYVAQYAGDTLWALMVFLGLGVVAPRVRTWPRAIVALALAYAVEISQLYHAPWIDALRHTTLGHLVLGVGFLWSDFACYTVGVAVGAALDTVIRRSRQPARNSTKSAA